jgi:hypothetical protein
MAAPLNTCTTIEQSGVVRFLYANIWMQQRISTKKCCPYGQHFFVDIYIYIDLYIDIYRFIYIYIDLCMCICMCVYVCVCACM